jgi:hypothetical protein
MSNFHDDAEYPHEGGCVECHERRLCNYCGTAINRMSGGRCTNGRCAKCHATVCTSGGSTSSGHGFGKQGKPWYRKERA